MDRPAGPARPYALQASEGWTYRYDADFCVKAGEARAGAGAAVLEYVARKGEEPSPHAHPTEEEMFYVLEGAITFHCGGASFDLGPGGFVYLPPGVPHTYAIPGDAPVRLLVVTAPVREGAGGGWGGFVAELELGQGELVARPGQAG